MSSISVAVRCCYLAELFSQSFFCDSKRSHPSDATGGLHLIHVQTLHALLCNQLDGQRSHRVSHDYDQMW